MESRDRRPLDRTNPDGTEDVRTRVRWSLRPATKATSLIAVSLVAVAVYYLLAPVFLETGSGWFPCGSVVSGQDDEFTANTCRGATNAHLAKSLLAAAVALIVGVGGAALFGADRIAETRNMTHRDDDGHDALTQHEDPRLHRSQAPRRKAGQERQRRGRDAAERSRRARDVWESDGWR